MELHSVLSLKRMQALPARPQGKANHLPSSLPGKPKPLSTGAAKGLDTAGTAGLAVAMWFPGLQEV